MLMLRLAAGVMREAGPLPLVGSAFGGPASFLTPHHGYDGPPPQGALMPPRKDMGSMLCDNDQNNKLSVPVCDQSWRWCAFEAVAEWAEGMW